MSPRSNKPSISLIVPALQEPEFARALSRQSNTLKFFTRGRRTVSSIVTAEQAAVETLGFPAVQSWQIPAAQCLVMASGHEDIPPAVCAEPVHVQAGADHARLYDARALQMSDQEAAALLDTLNQHFNDTGVFFRRGPESTWLVTGVDAEVPEAEPLSRVVDRHVAGFMDVQRQPRVWKQLLTEVQMLLHDHAVNEQRAERGLLAINSLWFWGGHKLAALDGVNAVSVFADDAFHKGLAALSGSHCLPVSQSRTHIGQSSQLVCVREFEHQLLMQNAGSIGDEFPGQMDQLGRDGQQWDVPMQQAIPAVQQAMRQLEQLVTSAQRALLLGRVDRVDLIPCNEVIYSLRRLDLLRFWSLPWSRRSGRDVKTGRPASSNQ